jgi:hypothetical protein
MEIDHYIDWHSARQVLVELAGEVGILTRMTNIMLAKADTLRSSDELFNCLIDNIELSDEQVEAISDLYLAKVRGIQVAVKSLGRGE